MRKERLTIEEIQAMPKDAFPFTVTCDDGHYTDGLSAITVLSPVLAMSCRIAIIQNNGTLSALFGSDLSHYPSLKQPNIKRFYERVGRQTWIADDGQMHSGLTQLGCDIKACDYFKTGRYFDWDIDGSKIVGKVEVE